MISTIFEVGTNVVDAILAIYFLTKFNDASFQKNRFALPAFFAIFGFTFVGDRLFPGFTLFPMIALFIFTSCYALSISRKHYVRAILSSCIFEVSYILTSSFLFIIISMIIQDFELLLQDSTSIFRYLLLILHKVALFAVLQLFLLLFRADSAIAKVNGLLTTLFTGITLFGLGAAMVLTAQPNAQEIQTQILLIIIAFIAANVLLYILLYQVQKLQRHKYELKLLQEKMQFEQDWYKELTAIHANVRTMRHDIKQHLVVISGYLQDDKVSDCKKYLQSVLEETEKSATPFHSGNAVLDYIIHSKLDACDDIRTMVMGRVADFSDIKDTDLACLIGNILDNAIEGVADAPEKSIELYFHVESDNRVILCKNTVGRPVLASNPDLRTTKSQKDAHGLGHKIIAKIVADYNGILNYYEENGTFSVQIILPMAPK